MINLLPPEEKQKLHFQKQVKMLVVLGIVAIVPLICFALMLLSIQFYLLGELSGQKITLQEAQQVYQTPDFLHFKGIIQKNNGSLVKLDSFYKQEVYMSHVFKTIFDVARPQNFYLNDITLVKGDHLPVKVNALGFSGSREDLLVFQKNLKENPNIANIIFSPESWVSPFNVDFNLSFEVK